MDMLSFRNMAVRCCTRILMWRGAPIFPILGGISLIALAEVTRSMAVNEGHCDVPGSLFPSPQQTWWRDTMCGVYAGSSNATVRIAFPAISPATRLPPERWVWTLGVYATCAFCFLPASLIARRMFQCMRHQHDNEDRRYAFVFALLVIALVCLVGEASVPLQGDILDATSIELCTFVHLMFAGALFMSLGLHGQLVIKMQCQASRAGRRSISLFSLRLKVLLACFSALSCFGLIPAVLLMACPQSVCDPRACMDNLGGLAQRCVVAGLALGLASYGLDFWAMQPSFAADPRVALGQMEVQLRN
mmetsp:Transcript_75816/g.190721  ORF Transcript_75816/g.190721 Transcript_75816/m.190721 type:complete len:304 (-) Transcript_75816:252-1163(-)